MSVNHAYGSRDIGAIVFDFFCRFCWPIDVRQPYEKRNLVNRVYAYAVLTQNLTRRRRVTQTKYSLHGLFVYLLIIYKNKF